MLLNRLLLCRNGEIIRLYYIKTILDMVGTGLCATLAGVVVFLGSHIPRLLPTSLGFTSCIKTNMWNKLISAFIQN